MRECNTRHFNVEQYNVSATLWNLFLLIILVFPNLAVGHGGGLNSEGCHTNRKTSEYHCHRGPNKGLIIPSRAITSPPSASYTPSGVNSQYDRDSFNFRSYSASGNVGFYTGKICSDMDIDHVVSLKDAHDSGASRWTSAQKTAFANDRSNHVEACSSVNRSKSSATPIEFLTRSSDGKGLEYDIKNWCEYVIKYHNVKAHYHLSTANNDMSLLSSCNPNASAPTTITPLTSTESAKTKCELIGYGATHPAHFKCIVKIVEIGQ